jgi:hypothetical protein
LFPPPRWYPQLLLRHEHLSPSPTVRLTYECYVVFPRSVRAIEQSSESRRAERIRLLSMVDVLEPLTAEQKDLLAQRTQERAFGKGDTVYAPGDASEVVFLLLEGRMRLYGMEGDRSCRSRWFGSARCSG